MAIVKSPNLHHLCHKCYPSIAYENDLIVLVLLSHVKNYCTVRLHHIPVISSS